MQIYYYTRTGRSKEIAKELKEKYNLEINEITDDENWKGALNYIKAGAMSCKKQKIKAKYKKILEKEDIILIFPVWAGSFPPTIRTFIEENNRENIIAIPTSLGTKFKDRQGFKKVYDLIGKEIKAPEIDV